jgi:arginine decarboxylase
MQTLSKKYFNIGQYRLDIWNNLKLIAPNFKGSKQPSTEEQAYIFELLDRLDVIERYWAYPGKKAIDSLKLMLSRQEFNSFGLALSNIFKALTSESYRLNPVSAKANLNNILEEGSIEKYDANKHYFEVMVVDSISEEQENNLVDRFEEVQNTNDKFIYNVLIVQSVQDALIALLFNPNLQCGLIRQDIPLYSTNNLDTISSFLGSIPKFESFVVESHDTGPILGEMLKNFRSEIDLFYITNTSISQIKTNTLGLFRRIFYRQEDIQELHLSILRGIRERYHTPFFNALRQYSQKPTGVFHAMPISRGNSVFKSNWIKSLGDFYGRNIFLAETSATTGGLDSLLQPTGSIKEAQQYAARAFGSKETFFVTNGTSTSNKIVLQALIRPGDVVLVDRDCHKSHHYGLVMMGAKAVYLDSYPIIDYSMYGAVPLADIKEKLYEFKEAGRLSSVKMLILTNCTFDGMVYNVERVMEEILAIKPDMVFLWDEAWFGFARFTPVYRQRTAMYNADKLSKKYKSPEYKEYYEARLIAEEGKTLNIPNPEEVKIRVYSTQSTHKTLTAFRQGSMIHVYDEEFKRKTEDAFHEAYMTHTSTSPNYQIVASLDIGRRQVELEGYEMVEKGIEMAMNLREKITIHPLLNKYFEVLTIAQFIPETYRSSGLSVYFDAEEGWSQMGEAWEKDEFVLDPTKITLYIGKTGIDGDTFKREFLMDKFGIQVNKTTRNTVLFMTNIGTTRSSVTYLVSVLLKVAEQIEEKTRSFNPAEMKLHEASIQSLTQNLPPLPNFSYFHAAFRSHWDTSEGNIRDAYFYAYEEEYCEYLKIEECEKAMEEEREIVSTNFVTPYPPGFPILVPGQVMTREIIDFMKALDVKEIHSYRPELGFRVFKEMALEKLGYKSHPPKPKVKEGEEEDSQENEPVKIDKVIVSNGNGQKIKTKNN